MNLTKWMVCMLAGALSFSMVVKADDKKEDAKHEKKAEKKKEEKKEEKKDEKKPVALPAAVKAAWDARYKGAEVLKVEDKKDSFEIKGKDALNESIKAVYGADGKLWSESSRKVALANVPEAVVKTAKTWAPAAKWDETAEVQTKKSAPSTWEVSGTIGDKKIKAEIAEDGKVVKTDKLPEAKEAKKEEKKEVKKEEKKETKKEEKK